MESKPNNIYELMKKYNEFYVEKKFNINPTVWKQAVDIYKIHLINILEVKMPLCGRKN